LFSTVYLDNSQGDWKNNHIRPNRAISRSFLANGSRDERWNVSRALQTLCNPSNRYEMWKQVAAINAICG